MITVDDIGVRDFTSADIEPMLEYWLSPENERYHRRRGTDPSKWIDPDRERRALTTVVETAIPERSHSAAVVVYKGQPVGHLLLNDVKAPACRRMHFHMWRRKIERSSLTDTITLTKKIVSLSLEYFFTTHGIDEIVGDVAVSNGAANFVLRAMRIFPSETVDESYLGETQAYNRYVFKRAPVSCDCFSAHGPL